MIIVSQNNLTDSEAYEFAKWPISFGQLYTITSFKDAWERHIIKVPEIIITLGEETLEILMPELVTRKGKGKLLTRFVGSILTSQIYHNCYIIPILSVQDIWKSYDQRDILISLDCEKILAEQRFLDTNHFIQPLPSYKMILNPPIDEILSILAHYEQAEFLSCDIETIRPRKTSQVFSPRQRHPGIPYCIGFSPSKDEALSFTFWDKSSRTLAAIFNAMQRVFDRVKLIGQNFYSFDVNFLEGAFEHFGFKLDLLRLYDTRSMHHLLYPELPHSLQFMTRQYTRQPYYKDEGSGWSIKNPQKLLHYNALDCLVTYDAGITQIRELEDRGLI